MIKYSPHQQQQRWWWWWWSLSKITWKTLIVLVHFLDSSQFPLCVCLSLFCHSDEREYSKSTEWSLARPRWRPDSREATTSESRVSFFSLPREILFTELRLFLLIRLRESAFCWNLHFYGLSLPPSPSLFMDWTSSSCHVTGGISLFQTQEQEAQLCVEKRGKGGRGDGQHSKNCAQITSPEMAAEVKHALKLLKRSG